MSLLPEGECSAGKVKSPLEQGCFKSAQQCPEQAVHLLVKLDCEKAKLLTWGNTVAILHTRNEGRFSQLDEPESEKLIHRFTSLPYAQDTGGENPCIDTKDVLKLLIVGDSAVRLITVYLMGAYLMGVYLMGVYLTGVHLTGVYLINVHLTGVAPHGHVPHGVHLIDVSNLKRV